MNRTKGIVIGIMIAVLVILGIFFVVGYFQPKSAGILVESNPNSLVYINEEQVGRTPYKGTRDEGEIILKLVPESQNGPIEPYETRIKLTGGIETVVRRQFGSTEELSSGVVISFEKVSKKETSLAVVSIPDTAQVGVDGIVGGFTPYKTENILSGNHRITVTAPGYLEGVYDLKAVQGYKLTAIVRLSPDENFTSDDEKGKKEETVFVVEILETPTGFLRVREEASTLGEEVARVEPGEVYDFLLEDEKTGWFKIKIDETTEGWVSGQYSKKREKTEEDKEGVETSPSPKPES